MPFRGIADGGVSGLSSAICSSLASGGRAEEGKQLPSHLAQQGKTLQGCEAQARFLQESSPQEASREILSAKWAIGGFFILVLLYLHSDVCSLV
ncbi:hypothetical protein E2320_010928 [Naja naja]|nr:hypothetical protein E2320_010928 [Naja naja]